MEEIIHLTSLNVTQIRGVPHRVRLLYRYESGLLYKSGLNRSQVIFVVKLSSYPPIVMTKGQK